MRCPRLEDLPAPPEGRTGWPWTIETPQLPGATAAGPPWPRLSIVVASLNQGTYIEEMIRSILLQGYSDVEFILIDGGSTDETQAIVARYEKWISYHVSEPDRGQSHAFNKGLKVITGHLFSIFDTDDVFLPDTFKLVGEAHVQAPDQIIAGGVLRFWEGSDTTELFVPSDITAQKYAAWWNNDHGQPGVFFPSCYLGTAGLLDESLHCVMDYEFMCRYLTITGCILVRAPIAKARYHASCKSMARTDYFFLEIDRMEHKYSGLLSETDIRCANRVAAGALFRAGCLRLLRGAPDSWVFLKRGFQRHPFWAVYFVFPGALLRRFSRLIRI